MTPEFLVGLQISLAGLAVTFLVLGLLTLVIRLLRWIFPAVSARPAREETQPEAMTEQQREETAAALAVAISLLENQPSHPDGDPALGKLLEP